MDERGLYDFRKEGHRTFDKVSGLRLFLGDLLGKDLVLPVVVGGRDVSEEYLEVQMLFPSTPSSVFTVGKYLECLRLIEEREDVDKFRGEVFYSGLDSLHYSNLDAHPLGVRVMEVDAGKNLQSCDLDFHFSDARGNGRVDDGYEAVSKITETRLEDAFKNFVGPNVKYRPRLI